jgi:superkiller protein 3
MNGKEERTLDDDTLQEISKIQDSISKKEWRVVEQMCHTILKRIPNEPEALMYLGIARAAQGFEPEGENLLLASLNINPRSKQAYYNLGLIVMNQGRCIFASDAFDHGLRIDPHDHALYYQRGCALERLGKRKEAIEHFEKAVLHTPTDEALDFTAAAKEAIQRISNET